MTTNSKNYSEICQSRQMNGVEVVGDILLWGFARVTSTLDEVRQALESEGFRAKIAGVRTSGMAFVRALRQLEKLGYAIDRAENMPEYKVFQLSAKNNTEHVVHYNPHIQYKIDKATGAITINNLFGQDPVEGAANLADIKVRTASCYEEVTAQDLNRVMIRIMNSEADIVKISDSRAVYFVPSGAYDTIMRVKSFLNKLNGEKLDVKVIPQMAATETMSMVSDSVKEEIMASIDKISSDLDDVEDVKRDDFWGNRIDMIEELRVRAIAYAALLRGDSADIEMALDGLGDKLEIASSLIPDAVEVTEEAPVPEVTEVVNQETSVLEVEEAPEVVEPTVIETDTMDYSNIW